MAQNEKKRRHQVFEADGWACRRCGTHRDLTIDHIIPLSRGGSGERSNLQTLCKACNNAKADLLPNDLSYDVPLILGSCAHCEGRGFLMRPFGRRCCRCDSTGRVYGKTKRLTRRQRRLLGMA